MLKRALAAFLLLSGVASAQTPSPGQLGLVVATPNVVQVLDTTKTWSTIGTINPATHLFTPSGGAGISDAPNDATLYGRKSLAWAHLTHNDIIDWAASVPPPTPPGGSSGQIQFNSGGSAFGGFTASGDATINTATGAVAVIKTGGTAFGALATVAPGTGVPAALGLNTNAAGGMVLVNGSPVVGNSLKWSATGVQDGGALPSASVQRFTALATLTTPVTPVCQINGCTPTGAGYSGASGTLTLTTNGGKFVCSTYPVLNATLTGANITAATVNTAGSCTVMGSTYDEVWTPGGSLVGGSGALFALNWTATAQTYTPTAGTKYATVYAYGPGGQGGGGPSGVSGIIASPGAGGGGGSAAACFISAAQIGVSQTVTIGLGGRNGGNPSQVASGPGTVGQASGQTTLGALCKAWGGGAGFGGLNAATASGGGAGAGIGSNGANGASGSAGSGAQCGGSGYGGGSPSNGCNGGGNGGGNGLATSGSSGGQPGYWGGAGGSSGGGVNATPAASGGGLGGVPIANGIPGPNASQATVAGQSGGNGINPATPLVSAECGGGGNGGAGNLTTLVAGNGGAGGYCSGGSGGGGVINGAGSAPGWGGAGGDGVLDVVEFH